MVPLLKDCISHLKQHSNVIAFIEMLDLGCGTCPWAKYLSGISTLHGVDISTSYFAYCMKQVFYTLNQRSKTKTRGMARVPRDEKWPDTIGYSFECTSIEKAKYAWKKDYNFILCNILLSLLTMEKVKDLI